jgi:RNA polymerase sigma-70 factor, ECF subfamily
MNQNSTRPSLLIRIRDRQDADAWIEFFDLYSPLLYSYARDRGLNHEDAEDIRASCYETIVKRIGEFEYNKQKTGFRAWLRTMVNRRVLDLFRKKQLPNAESSELRNVANNEGTNNDLWEKHWRLHHLRYCVALVGKRVKRNTFEAFKLLTDEGLEPDQVSQRMKMNIDQIYKIKSRMLKMISAEMKNFDLD